MKVVRFCCPKCRSLHSASVARIGQVFPCKVCFGPMVVPEPTAGASPSEVPVASAPRPPGPARVASPPVGTARPAAPVAGRPSRVQRPVAPTPAPVPPPFTVAESQVSPGPEARPSTKQWAPARGTVVRGAVSVALVALVVVALAGIRSLGRSRPGVALAVAPPIEPDARTLPAPAIEPPSPLPAPEPVAPHAPPVATASPIPQVDDPGRLLVIRRQMLDQEALIRQLAQLPELAAEDTTQAGLIGLHGVPYLDYQGRLAILTQNQLAAKAEALKAIQQMQEITPAHRSNAPRHQVRHHQPAASHHQPATASQPPAVATPAHPSMHVAHEEVVSRDMLALIRKVQPELAALPWRMGDECHLGREAAEDLQAISRALRNLLVKVTPQGDTRPDADQLRGALFRSETVGNPSVTRRADGVIQVTGSGVTISGGKIGVSQAPRAHFFAPAAIPALQQLLMAERTPVRIVLAEVLAEIPGRDATRALARLAMFDLAPEVRERALAALKARPVADGRRTLLEGLRYPWPPVADHAAEALVALGDREAIPALVELLDRPDPARPRTEVRDGKPVTLVSSVVQVNHLRNCVLCHAPSGNPVGDLVRGRVPEEFQPIPPPVEYYENASAGLFVRAEVTYLRQDFSTTQPVERADPWPSYQRYDYLVAERVVANVPPGPGPEAPQTFPQRESALFALRELTGRDLGGRSGDWKVAVADTP